MGESYRDAPPQKDRCPLCGSSDLTWGEVRAQGMRFLRESASGWSKAFGLGTGMRARLCGACRNVQLYADADD